MSRNSDGSPRGIHKTSSRVGECGYRICDVRWSSDGRTRVHSCNEGFRLLIREEDLSRAFTVARALGFDVERVPLNFDGGSFKLRRLSKVVRETQSLITVDFILVTEAISDVWEDREHLDWASGSAWVVSRRGLIKMKMAAGRDQDLLDIRKLEEEHDES